jgi:LAGLIDADG DNA endonuclease family
MKSTIKLLYSNNYNLDKEKLRNITILPKFLDKVLIGIMLGDGGIYKTSFTSNSRFEMSFGTKYKQFAESLGILFKEYMNTSIKTIEVKGKNKNYINFRLKTISLPIFNKYHDMFYIFNTKTGKYQKIIPKNISELLDPIVLSYLIQTDGNFDKNRNRIRIYTNSYTKEEVQNLANAINTNLNIFVGVLHDRKDQWILTIGAKQLPLLRELTSNYFEPNMLYRLGI